MWRDLNLQRHQNNPNSPHSSAAASFRGSGLQDFFAAPFMETTAAAEASHQEKLPNLPPTALSLNSALNHHFDYNYSSIGSQPSRSVGLFSFCPMNNNPRSVMLEGSTSIGGRERRNKRVMKNRESAARSRARKQAYTNELELEIAHLAAENEKLKKQFEELRLAMEAHNSTKKTHQRTLTAPF